MLCTDVGYFNNSLSWLWEESQWSICCEQKVASEWLSLKSVEETSKDRPPCVHSWLPALTQSLPQFHKHFNEIMLCFRGLGKNI